MKYLINVFICVLLICIIICQITNRIKHYIFIYAKVEPYYNNIFNNLQATLEKKYEPLLFEDGTIKTTKPHITLECLRQYIINDNHDIIKTIRKHFTNLSNVNAIYKGIGCFILNNRIVINAEFNSDVLESIQDVVSSEIPEVGHQREYMIYKFNKVPSKIIKLYPNYTYNNSILHMVLINVNLFIGEDKLNEIIFFCNKCMSDYGIYKLQHIQIQSIEYINTSPLFA